MNVGPICCKCFQAEVLTLIPSEREKENNLYEWEVFYVMVKKVITCETATDIKLCFSKLKRKERTRSTKSYKL